MNKLKEFYWKLIENKWQLGFPRTTIEDIVAGKPYEVDWLRGTPDDRWFADPFVLDATPSHIILLVEEYFYYNEKGRLARLTISRSDFSLEKNETILDLDTHLSFPTIIRKDDKIYIYPENSACGALNVYEYDVNTNKCLLKKKLCNEPLTDAVFTEIEGKPYIFSTQMPNPNGNVLNIYQPNDKGDFVKTNEVKFDENDARNGGGYFSINGNIYRPAQCCDGGYGRALSIQRVMPVNGTFKFEEVARLKSPSKRFDQGMHTLNHYKDVVVIDVRGYRWPSIGRPIDAIRNLF